MVAPQDIAAAPQQPLSAAVVAAGGRPSIGRRMAGEGDSNSTAPPPARYLDFRTTTVRNLIRRVSLGRWCHW